MKNRDHAFTPQDLRQIQDMGLTPEKVAAQIDSFKRGFPYLELDRPCTLQDGIKGLDPDLVMESLKTWAPAQSSGRAMKFVPASGAASRMFRSLLAFHREHASVCMEDLVGPAEKGDAECGDLVRLLEEIRAFAFYEDLQTILARDGLDAESLLQAGRLKELLDYILTPKGLGLADLPKALIKFHAYGSLPGRTPIEEHLVEALEYVRDCEGRTRIHFTVPSEHEAMIRRHVEKALSGLQGSGAGLQVGFSIQSPSTDTIAVDMENRPFRDDEGRLVFRPGGHGALLENLNRLGGDIVFIKNIDNVLPDHRKKDTFLYKKALGGYLVLLQQEVFFHLGRLTARPVEDSWVREAASFASQKLALDLASGLSKSERTSRLVSLLNRPLRVCGMVRNEGEPGGGPFWVRGKDGALSCQIVESSQVDMGSSGQRKIWESSTHFNPVDLVCALRDRQGTPFALQDFVDPGTGFVSVKSMEGRDLKALEVPGLWNGAMAHWNTVFVEVPLSTFSPVKTLLDLLRPEHQP